MTRFRPTVEALDARTLPSAVFAGPDDPTSGQPVRFAVGSVEAADQDGTPAAKGTGGKADASTLRITLSDVLVSSWAS